MDERSPDSLAPALARWISETHPEYELDGLSLPKLVEDEGSPGYSEYTPGEPWALSVFFDYRGSEQIIEIREGEVGPFIERMVGIVAETRGERGTTFDTPEWRERIAQVWRDLGDGLGL